MYSKWHRSVAFQQSLPSCLGTLPAVRVWARKTVPYSSRPVWKLVLLCVGRVFHGPHIQRRFFGRVKPRPWFYFTVPVMFAAIKHRSSHHIRTWSMRRLCSVSHSSTCLCQICDPSDIHWIALTQDHIVSKICGFSIATLWILARSQLWQREVKQRIKLHHVYIGRVPIQSELTSLIGDKIVNFKWRDFGGKTGPSPMVRVIWVVRPFATGWFRGKPEPEPTQEFGSSC